MLSCLSDMSNFLQGLPNKCAPGCESCLPVLAYEFSMAMAATFSQPVGGEPSCMYGGMGGICRMIRELPSNFADELSN